MLKKFFIAMLGTIAGVWVSFVIIVIGGLVLAGAFLGSAISDSAVPQVKRHTILKIDLSGSIVDREQPSDIWQLLSERRESEQSLINILDGLRIASTDKDIDGVYLKCDGSSAGFASREEIVSALSEFKNSGKWVLAYSDNYSQGDYLIACMADTVYVNAIGRVDVRGIASTSPFFTGLLDKLGIKAEVVKVGTYKSAVEPFILKEMSVPARMQMEELLGTIWNYCTSVIEKNRHVSVQTVNMWADSIISTWPTEKILTAGAVDKAIYRRQLEDVLRELTGIDEDDPVRIITPSEYVKGKPKKFGQEAKDHIAVLFAQGDIVDSGDGGIVAEEIVPEILDLAENEKVKGLVMRVNSGGGSAFASEQIWEALEYFKSQGKPFYVSMGDYAASGGYYISCGADCIYADATTLTGSIGVFGLMFNLSELAIGKLGVNFSTVETNPNANFPSFYSEYTAQQRASLQRSVDATYDLFTSRVADGRGLTVDSVKVIGEGRVWAGSKALELGLIDNIGGLNDAIGAIASRCGITSEKVVYYPVINEDYWQEFIMNSTKNMSVGGLEISSDAINTLRFISGLKNMNPVQARMNPVELR